jgi:hypothetical protein
LMVCRECRLNGIINSFVVKHPVQHPAHKTSIVRLVCSVCLMPATCLTFETHSNDEGSAG